MSIETDYLDDEFDRYASYNFEFMQPTAQLAPTLSPMTRANIPFERNVDFRENQSELEVRTQKIRRMILNAGASGEVKVEVSWGDKDGTKVNIGASGQIEDKNGNYAKAEVKHDNDGKGSASVSAGHKNEESGKGSK